MIGGVNPANAAILGHAQQFLAAGVLVLPARFLRVQKSRAFRPNKRRAIIHLPARFLAFPETLDLIHGPNIAPDFAANFQTEPSRKPKLIVRQTFLSAQLRFSGQRPGRLIRVAARSEVNCGFLAQWPRWIAFSERDDSRKAKESRSENAIHLNR